MDFAIDFGQLWLQAWRQFFTQPFYFLGVLFVILQVRRQILLERRLYNSRLHSLVQETWRILLWGFIGGVVVSLIMIPLGAVLTPGSLLLVWAVSFILMLFRVRYLCMAYSVGILGIAHTVLSIWPTDAMGWLGEAIVELHLPSLIALVGILHLMEALFIRWQGSRIATPMFYEGKRGKLIGGYHLQGFWPLPLFLLVPMSSGTGMSFVGGESGSLLPWLPFFGGDMWSQGWTVLAFPMVIGFMESTVSQLPKDKVRRSSSLLFLYSLLLIGLAILIEFVPVLTILAAILCFLLHELLVWYSKRLEEQSRPRFVHDHRGLMVLGIIPQSVAAEMGIMAGEIIQRVNGMQVTSKEELHRALQTQSAFCKLEVINEEGHVRFVHRALFAGDHHQLGIILAPDEQAMYFAGASEPSLLALISAKLKGVSKRSNTSHME